jgi:3-oxoacyl-[acyl-carrier-protein] synthase III
MPEALLPVENRPVASDPRAYDLLATISALASATPETSLNQAEVLDLLGLADNGFAKEVFARCGVRTRGLEVSSESLERTLQQRTELTEEQLMRLATQAVDGLGADLSEVGVVVTANYYSLGGPTLAHRLVDHYALRPDADKYHIVGVGCASAVPLLRLASQALRDRPAEKALVVAAESTSGFLSPVTADDEKVKIVGSALFGDGAAAALLSLEAAERGHAAGPRIVATAVHQLPGTLDHVRFAVTGEDTHMRMARGLPALARVPRPPPSRRRHDRPLAAASRRTGHHRRTSAWTRAERGGCRPQRRGALRARQRGDPVSVPRAPAHDRRSRTAAGTARPRNHDRPGRDDRPDAAAVVTEMKMIDKEMRL